MEPTIGGFPGAGALLLCFNVLYYFYQTLCGRPLPLIVGKAQSISKVI